MAPTSTAKSLTALRARIAGRSGKTAEGDVWLEVIIVVLAAALAGFALREYIAPDYRAEILPALAGLEENGLRGYLENLPGYPAAALIELIPAKLALMVGASEAGVWRMVSGFGISVLALAVLATLPFIRAVEAPRGAARVAVALAVASPAAYWALRIGHAEELFSTGFLLAAAIAAARERPVIAGVLLGLAVGKAWPAVAALPVLGLLLPDPRRVLIGAASAAVAAGVFYVPSLIYATDSVESLTALGVNSIFNVGQVFWWFGTPIPEANVLAQVVPQPRVGPEWAGELSHPLILGVGTAIGGIWCWSLFGRLRAGRSVASLRSDGRTRSNEEVAQLAGAALLVMAGILYARCFLDTWNVPYYLLPGLVLGAIGEILSGRRPIITLVATGLMWKWHAPGDLTVRTDPDIYTALYLAWTIPVCVTFLTLGFKDLHKIRAVPASPPGATPAPGPAPGAVPH